MKPRAGDTGCRLLGTGVEIDHDRVETDARQLVAEPAAPGADIQRPATLDDVVDILLEIAERLENLVAPGVACPQCGERRPERLVWQNDTMVRCTSCQGFYEP